MKKIFSSVIVVLMLVLLLVGCGKKEEKETEEKLDLSVKEILDKVYDGISEEELPALVEIPLDKENLSAYLGVEELDFKEGIASEPMMGSIAWSVVVVEVNDGVNVEQAKKDIKEKVNPAKWICVDAEFVAVESKGNKIILIMMDELNEEYAKKIQDNFKDLK